MRALVQRVLSASVTVDAEITGQIDQGLLVLVCAMQGDTEKQSDWLAAKISKLRIFSDDAGKMNRSLLDIGGAALVVSQFTLAADTRGNRPGFSTAAAPDLGRALYEHFSKTLAGLGVPVANGIFAADMKVALINDGPITIWLDTEQ
ncbi:MAG: D-tyrosyl-tRNA(Tyr) deacylase [Devosia sp.]|jgi:D-tyrosyl-tRNA(Tyr) deacylase|uniref:D-aminoacyl-tRNA deacylase n=1 Tax=unclassified Devosia TaxID=196773 RepID=UPI0019ED1CE4|nr:MULTISPECIES: D-aminoacyl-tRNA deacylase [unclassified Devosia]MBF0679209.1 D-tyrosyl-tRNA(Tyr) deacylase [Devosia sp.]WEJ35154.1 D-aminoacyl-tRNA deacylase [Devosia sp. SD17-2]